MTQSVSARHWRLGGQVQGVGFRPFVYRAALRHGLRGWVRNVAGQVEILAEGSPAGLTLFADALLAAPPPAAAPVIVAERAAPLSGTVGFSIRDSADAGPAEICVPRDRAVCEACLAEMRDPANRRFRHPFITCTQCGPRYTIVARLPYDRAHTAMRGFQLCSRCAAEYADPADRRFHAEPISCPDCGPRLTFSDGSTGEIALAGAVGALRAGLIVAVKGVGGYHLMCDATDNAAVARLRARKRRPDKPLAVMVPDEGALHAIARPAMAHLAALQAPARPIVLVPARSGVLAAGVAPGCPEIGVMLPYSPLHALLLADFGGPLVATSGNVSGEPVLTEAVAAQARLGTVADVFLHHDRPILHPADDPLYRVIAGAARPLRLGRGDAPCEMRLPFRLTEPVLALGGHLKATLTLAWDDRAVTSPHLGEMESPRAIALLRETAASLETLYGVTAARVLCDMHPGYATTRLAEASGLPVTRVLHHHAHAAALAGEVAEPGPWLVFTWDGAGHGDDGTTWGGEALLGVPGAWRRVASWRPFSLLGGDRAAREPWRSALALQWEAGRAPLERQAEATVLRHAYERGLNCPRNSSVGRLFDAAAALLGLCRRASYEGQAALALEAAVAGPTGATPLPLRADAGLWRSDWEPLLDILTDPDRDVGERAGIFHESLALALLDQARAIRAAHGVTRIGLAGGVFQNRVLSEAVMRLAAADGFQVALPKRLPCNDAALSFGQVVEAGWR